MGFYEEQQSAFKELNRIMTTALAEKKEIDIKLLIYKLTLNYAVGERALRKRLDFWLLTTGAEIRDDKLVVDDVLE
jgi:hypothetical protein